MNKKSITTKKKNRIVRVHHKLTNKKSKIKLIKKKTQKRQYKHRLKKSKKSKVLKSLKTLKTPITSKPNTNKIQVVKEKKRRRRKKTASNKMYFTEETENAITEYNNTVDQTVREKIFEEKIKYPFEKLVENIFNKFKFSYFEVGPLDIQKETVTHLVANIHKFHQSKGKAYSYFSIVAKNYLIFLNNSNYKKFNQSVEITEDHEDNTIQLQSADKYYKQKEMSEFLQLMITYWDNNIGKIFTKQRDLNIANAVIELLRNSDKIETFNKKSLYLYIREISNCKTQQITKVINKLKVYYANLNKAYINNGTLDKRQMF